MTTQVATQQTPIILGSDVNQTQLEMKLIEAQLAASPYGDSPLLKIISAADDTPEKPNPARLVKFIQNKTTKTNRFSLLYICAQEFLLFLLFLINYSIAETQELPSKPK